MDELIFSGELTEAKMPTTFLVANVSEISSEGISLSLNGGAEILKKKYMHLDNGTTFTAGDRVLVASVSGTYVILGKITR